MRNWLLSSIVSLSWELTDIALKLQVTLARGLNYYTGTIFEIAAPSEVQMGSVGGGGRYDKLTDIFGLKDVSGVGISFGLDRIFLVMEEMQLFPTDINRDLDVFFLNFGPTEAFEAMKLLRELRIRGIQADLYPDMAKVQKQMKYANQRKVPFVVLLGEQEIKEGVFVVKNMDQGDQTTFQINSIDDFLTSIQAVLN